ncbi:unnamed protein product [Callosobruchus maculatus]|uniref:Phosphatase and actin regulator 1 n=1 Tax=Callosobruchus maculatus TaxID=64391 RepID=A0A653BM39_CALMS|nr:unnamed protein product [Callosobruchus maculatus]
MHEKTADGGGGPSCTGGAAPAPNTAAKPKTVAIVAPTRSNSLDYLNFEEKRRLIASSLSLSDFLTVGTTTDAKEFREIRDGVTTVFVSKKQNGAAFRTNSLGGSGGGVGVGGHRSPPLERKSKFSIGKLLRPWKWKRKRKSDKLEAVSRTLERKISVRANRDELVLKGILLPESPLSPPKSEPGESATAEASLSLNQSVTTTTTTTTTNSNSNSVFPALGVQQHLPGVAAALSSSAAAPGGGGGQPPPPPYPCPSPGGQQQHQQPPATMLPLMNHATLQQQLLQNPHFAHAAAQQHQHHNHSNNPSNSATAACGALGSLFERLVTLLCFGEPKKDKTDGSAAGAAQNGGGGALSPNGETPQDVAAASAAKPERPSSLGHGGGGKLTRRLLCYHSEHFSEGVAHQQQQHHHQQQQSMGVTASSQHHMGGVGGVCGAVPPPFVLPEPPIPVSEIGPIPPPPMFSSPSPVPPPPVAPPTSGGRLSPPPPHPHPTNATGAGAGGDYDYDENDDEVGGVGDDVDDDEDDEDPSDTSEFCEHHLHQHHHHHGGGGGGAPSGDDSPPYSFRMNQPDPAIDTTRIDEIPAKSALKKKGAVAVQARPPRSIQGVGVVVAGTGSTNSTLASKYAVASRYVSPPVPRTAAATTRRTPVRAW